MIKFVLLACLLGAALALPHHSSSSTGAVGGGHGHDSVDKHHESTGVKHSLDDAAEPEKPAEPAKSPVEEAEKEKPAEAAAAAAAKPEDKEKEADKEAADSVRREDQHHKETPVVPVEHAASHHNHAETKPKHR